MAQCTAAKADGSRCNAQALTGCDLCFTHDPAHAQARADARRRGGYNRRTPKAGDAGEYPTRLRSVCDVQTLLEAALRDTVQQENSGARTGALVRIAQGALKVLELGAIEERLSALEARLEEGVTP